MVSPEFSSGVVGFAFPEVGVLVCTSVVATDFTGNKEAVDLSDIEVLIVLSDILAAVDRLGENVSSVAPDEVVMGLSDSAVALVKVEPPGDAVFFSTIVGFDVFSSDAVLCGLSVTDVEVVVLPSSSLSWTGLCLVGEGLLGGMELWNRLLVST